MKRNYLICCAFISFFVLIIVAGYFALFKPVGTIGDTQIRAYRIYAEAMQNKAELLDSLAEDMAFDQLCRQLNVTVDDKDVKREAEKLDKQFPGLNQSEIMNICKKSMLRQKAIEKLAVEVTVTADLARTHYENNMDIYGESEPEFAVIKHDIQMEMGEKRYEEELEKIRSGYPVTTAP